MNRVDRFFCARSAFQYTEPVSEVSLTQQLLHMKKNEQLPRKDAYDKEIVYGKEDAEYRKRHDHTAALAPCIQSVFHSDAISDGSISRAQRRCKEEIVDLYSATRDNAWECCIERPSVTFGFAVCVSGRNYAYSDKHLDSLHALSALCDRVFQVSML